MGLFGIQEVPQQPTDVSPTGETGASDAATDGAESNPSGVQGQPADGAEEQAITADDGSQQAEEPASEDGAQAGQTPPTEPEQGTGNPILDTLAAVAEGMAGTETSSSTPLQTSTPPSTTPTSSTAQTIDAFLSELLTQIDTASTPEQLQAPLQQATAMLPACKPQESFQQAREEGEARSEEEKKAQEQAKLKQQQMQSTLRDVFRNGRIKCQQLSQAAEKAGNPKEAALARQMGYKFTAGQKELAETETKRMQEAAKSLYKEFGSLMKGGGKLSQANQVVAKGARAGEGEEVTADDLEKADKMAEVVPGDEELSAEDAQKQREAQQARRQEKKPSWRREIKPGSKEELEQNETLARQTTLRDPTKTPPTAAGLLDATARLAASTGPYRLTSEQAAKLKEKYSCPEGRAATTALKGGALAQRRGDVHRLLGIVHDAGEEDDSGGSHRPTPESGALSIASALTALVGGCHVVPPDKRFVAAPSRPVPTIDWLDPVSGKNSVVRLSDLAYRRSGSFVSTLRREDYFGSTFDPDAYHRALALGGEISMSMLQRCPPSTGPVELHVG